LTILATILLSYCQDEDYLNPVMLLDEGATQKSCKKHIQIMVNEYGDGIKGIANRTSLGKEWISVYPN